MDGERSRKSRTFYRVRVGVLLTTLAGVLLYAVADVRARRSRNAWDHTVYVAIVVIRSGHVEPRAIDALRARIPALEDRLADELRRYRPGAPRPFRFQVAGPVDARERAPVPQGNGPIDLAKHAFALSRWAAEVDERAGLETGVYESRIYLGVRQATVVDRTLVEGHSEQGGRIGIVDVEIDPESVDLPLTVVAHELLHTLGATDKYGPMGRALVPGGLAEPAHVPLYPQRFAELMARNRPVSPTEERVPESLAEIAIGPETAREIGWAQ